MTDQSIRQSGTEQNTGAEQNTPRSRWHRLPLCVALVAVALVWIGGCIWSFEEQTGYARSKSFHIPQLLPLVIDGLAVALAAVAWAASLDGRPAVFARLGTAVAVAASALSNAAWAWERSGADSGTVALAAAVPVAANLAFEVLLAESRRQVLRRRGVPAPVAVPYPRLVRIFLAPWSTFLTWRRLVLAATDMAPLFAAASTAAKAAAPAPKARPALAERSAPMQSGAEQNALPAAPAPAPEPKAKSKSKAKPAAPVVPLHVVGSESSRTAVADAGTLRAKYGDALPARGAHALVQGEFGWGGQKTTNAIKAYRQNDDMKERSA